MIAIYTIFLCPFLLLLQLSICYGTATITLDGSIRDSQGGILVSAGQSFQFGFFTPDDGPDGGRYVGIRYNNMKSKVVWVANRNQSLTIHTGVFTLTKDGELKLLHERNNTEYWSTTVGVGRRSSLKRNVTLMDSGNLVLSEEDQVSGSWKVLWQSFDDPTDTFLPGMKMGKDTKLTSWKTASDPGTGRFTFQQVQERDNQYIIHDVSGKPIWKSQVFGDLFTSGDDINRILSYFLSNFSRQTRVQELGYSSRKQMINFTQFLTRSGYNNTRLVMNFEGKIQFLKWNDETSAWSPIRTEPSERCHIFNACGDFSSCNSKNWMLCKCLPGYEPKSLNNWNSGDFSEGCKRNFQVCNRDDNFLSMKMMKMGGGVAFDVLMGEEECRKKCLRDCSCQAYAYVYNTTRNLNRCWIWSDKLSNIREYTDEGYDIYFRVVPSAIGKFILFELLVP